MTVGVLQLRHVAPIAVLTLSVLAPSMARADAPAPGEKPPAPILLTPPRSVAPMPASRLAAKTPSTALALSLSPTLVGLSLGIFALVVTDSNTANAGTEPIATGLMIAGAAAFLIGPTLGHVYSGSTWNRGLKIRLAGLGIAALGGIVGAGDCHSGAICSNQLGGIAMAVIGGGIIVAGTAIEVATAPSSARAYNAKRGVTLGMRPIATHHGTVPSVFLGGTF